MISIKLNFDPAAVAKVQKAIEKAEQDIVSKQLIEGAQKAGAYLEGEAKRLCVVDTGRLRNSITHDVSISPQSITIVVGTNVEYAPYVEFGTGPVGAESTAGQDVGADIQYRPTPWVYPTGDGGFRYTRGQPARPFLYPALLHGRNNVIAIITNAIKQR